jgi:YYY domain-containing protein
MLSSLLWYLSVTLLGLATFPLAYRFLPALPDRGYALSRTLGLLLWGYLFWILGSLGILKNDLGGQLFVLVLILALSGLSLRGSRIQEMRLWFKSQRGLILGVEGLFLVAFGFMVIVRAANPEILGTEKPMELAFINAILRSPSFPPNDPWLAGYAISYYHFGYILVAMLARLTGVPGGVAFNLGISLVFALSATGAYGILYDLLAHIKSRTPPSIEAGEAQETTPGIPPATPDSHSVVRNSLLALFGPLFLLLVSNFEGFLELLHSYGLFWKLNPGGGGTSSFWSWLDILDLRDAPSLPLTWIPRHWWWWRASRVLQDYDFAHVPREIIDEFPAFSYVLGDLHPHVLAMPFAFLAIAVALNLYFGGCRGQISLPIFSLKVHLNAQSLLPAALVIGGMGFLNFWDFPTYLILFLAVYILLRAEEDGWGWGRLKDFLTLGLVLGVSSLVLYLPFYLGFSSQAGGVIPNLIYVTRGAHLWVMFGTLLIPLFLFSIYLWKLEGNKTLLKKGVWLAVGILLALWVSSLLLALLIPLLPKLQNLVPEAAIAFNMFLGSLNAPNLSSLLSESFRRRLLLPAGVITLLALLMLALGLLLKRREQGEGEEPSRTTHYFALLLVLLGTLLVLAPEFYYLRDLFGSRMNTIFKFYFQAWTLWAIAAAFGCIYLLQSLRRTWGAVFRIGLALVLGMALVYPLLGFWTKTNGFKSEAGWTLDGGAYIKDYAPDELAAIHWLQTAPAGFIVEAVRPDGGQYSDFARVAAYSGLPTVLGWVGHEDQWRGGYTEIGSRQSDIERLYITRDWSEAQSILKQYAIRYVIIGPRERSTYHIYEPKFQRFLKQVFQQGDMTIYEVP